MENVNEKAYIFGSIFTLANKLQALGDKLDPNLTVKQWMLIAGIMKNESEAPTISEVAQIIGNSRQNVKKMALILEREGFLELNKDKNDARILRVSVTQKCKEHFKHRENDEYNFLVNLFDELDVETVLCLAEGISKLENNINKMEANYSRNEKEKDYD